MYLNYLLLKIKMILHLITEILNSNIYSIWENAFFYLFVIVTILFFIIIWIIVNALKKKTVELKLLQQQYFARIDSIRKEHSNVLESLRIEMLKHEEDRIRQWMESEKETLHVLNGVSTLLELSDKIDKVEFKNLHKTLLAIERKINNGEN